MFGVWITAPHSLQLWFQFQYDNICGDMGVSWVWRHVTLTACISWSELEIKCVLKVWIRVCVRHTFSLLHTNYTAQVFASLSLSITHSDWSLTSLCLEDETHQAETVQQNKVWFSVLICVAQVQFPARRMRLVWWKPCLLVTTRWFVLLTTSASRWWSPWDCNWYSWSVW